MCHAFVSTSIKLHSRGILRVVKTHFPRFTIMISRAPGARRFLVAFGARGGVVAKGQWRPWSAQAAGIPGQSDNARRRTFVARLRMAVPDLSGRRSPAGR